MKFFIRAQSDAMMAINRCNIDADRGRSALALARYQELTSEIPDNAQILYAEGLLRRDFLGQGVAALELFRRAYELATSQGLKTDTAWFAACNATGLARDAEEFRHWTEIAMRGCPVSRNAEKQHHQRLLETLGEGEDYLTILLQKLPPSDDSKEHVGSIAATLEVALLIGSDSLGMDLGLKLHKERALLLRALDVAAQHSRGVEAFPPDERTVLQEAVREIEWVVEKDSYDAEAWNYYAAWCGLLERHEEAITAADRAIKLRPDRYARPHVNKAYSLYLTGRQPEALGCAQKALRQAELENSTQEIAQARTLIARYSAHPRPPSWEEIMPEIERVLQTAMLTSKAELAQMPQLPMNQLSETILNHAKQVQDQTGKAFVPMVAQLLGDFTPETAFCVALEIATTRVDVVEACLGGALYLAAFSSGVQRKDAARFLILMFLFHRDARKIRMNYRQAVLEPTNAATDDFSQLDSILRGELARVHPALPHLISDQEPVDEVGRARARGNILFQFSGEPPPPIRTKAPGCLGMVTLMFCFLLIVLVAWKLF